MRYIIATSCLVRLIKARFTTVLELFFIFDTQSDLFCQVSLEPCIFTNEVRFGENIAKLFLISYNIIMHESY